MSRVLKIELDIPEFEKELEINITIKKDGEVVYTASSPSGDIKKVEEEKKPTTQKAIKSKAKKTEKGTALGNFMSLDL